MKGIFDTLVNAFRVPDLRKKIFFTFGILIIYMIGGLVPSPAMDRTEFSSIVQNQWGQIGRLMDILSAGGLYSATIFSMGITPYVNSSIIIQLLTVAIPALERLQKEGEVGRKKIQQIVRFTTIGLALVQAGGFCYATRSALTSNIPTAIGAILTIATFTAGTGFIMWLGEQINSYGIGNGISLLVFSGIVTRLPNMAKSLYDVALNISGQIESAFLGISAGILFFVLIIAIEMAILLYVLFIQNAERRITVQYSKKVVGRKTYGGQNTYIPIKVNQSGVMPVIFAMSMVSLPSTIVTIFFSGSTNPVVTWFSNFTSSPVYYVVDFLLIVGFTFFYSLIQFNPIEISNNLQKNGGFIPGVRPGRPTSDYIARTVGRLNWADALFLSSVVLIPTLFGQLLVKVTQVSEAQNLLFVGTSILILTGVANDLVKQIESQMVTHHYKGFLD